MSEFRQLVTKRILDELYGSNGEGGVVATITSGAPKDYAVYRDMCGFVRGLKLVTQLMDEIWAEMHEPPPPPPQQNTGAS